MNSNITIRGGIFTPLAVKRTRATGNEKGRDTPTVWYDMYYNCDDMHKMVLWMGAKHERVANETKWENQKHNRSTLRIVHIDLNRIVLRPLPGDKVVQHRGPRLHQRENPRVSRCLEP